MERALVVNNKAIYVEPLKILEDIKAELTNGKLARFYMQGTDNISVTCPWHNDGQEHKNSAYLYVGPDESIEFLTFHCFTDGKSCSFQKFVGACFDRSAEFGARWLLTKYAAELDDIKVNMPEIVIHKEEEKKYLDDSVLDKFESYHPYMTQRKMSNEVIEKFKIKYDPKTMCIVFPVWDYNNRLKFLTRRSVVSKKFIIDKGADKSDIYLLNFCKNERTVFVCESQINCLTLWSWGYPSIALLGCGTTEEQIEVLNKSGIRHFVLCYDGDRAGRDGAERFKAFINPSKLVTDITMPDKTDVNDLTKEEFDKLYENAIE